MNIQGRLTSGFSLVVHEVSAKDVKLWIGALKPSIAKPHLWQLILKDDKGKEISKLHYEGGWDKRPFDKLAKRFYQVITLDKLKAGKEYSVDFNARSEKQYKNIETAYFSTLPKKIPDNTKKPFTVATGSCFYPRHDGGQTGQSYQALYENEKLKPDIKFLTGDQVYLDIGMGWYPLNSVDAQDRVADDYAESWDLMRSLLRRGGTWMLPDDHEYWNNYPYLRGFNPYLITLDKNKSFRKRWEHAANQGVFNVQLVKPIRIFDIGKDLSFCVADLRTQRGDNGFIQESHFKQLSDWAKNLKMPGVLVIPQPLIAKAGDKNDYSLPYWKKQYDTLIQDLASCNHDIVVLTGDVHYGRVAEVKLGDSKGRLIEVITSPMSNLSELNGIAAAKPEKNIKKFPPKPIEGIPKRPIKYLRTATTESRWWDLRYPVRRTTEHFMTLEFHKTDGNLQMKVNAWNARDRVPATGLPKRNFRPLTFKLI